MKMFFHYFDSLVHAIPAGVLYGLVFFSMLVVVYVLILQKNNDHKKRAIFTTFLLTYYSFLMCSTVIFRETQLEYQYYLTPLWSYSKIAKGDNPLLMMTILNMVMFIPIGLLLYYVVKYKKLWRVGLGGFILSFGIEILQLILKKGTFEVDDIFHNTLGCIIGFCVGRLLGNNKSSKKSHSRIGNINPNLLEKN